MAIAIEIRRTSQPPTSRKSRAERAGYENIIVHIPNSCLPSAGITDHPVRVVVAVKVSHDSPSSARCDAWRRCGCGACCSCSCGCRRGRRCGLDSAVHPKLIEIRGPATNDRIVELKRVVASVQSDRYL